ncbi:hypothetical protein GCM10007907_19680 [Chitinimonas prasina]|uniref:Uncharacterized protein n=1 Tax=Chitinimonas prasina TaxID=1434937 RepID=A0ABQ5YHM5_9NEIS|nr:hypothetical protein GCM10007907_19680 [Chitinimonas prasina]
MILAQTGVLPTSYTVIASALVMNSSHGWALAGHAGAGANLAQDLRACSKLIRLVTYREKILNRLTDW